MIYRSNPHDFAQGKPLDPLSEEGRWKGVRTDALFLSPPYAEGLVEDPEHSRRELVERKEGIKGRFHSASGGSPTLPA